MANLVPFRRVTTLAETLDDRYNLELWKQRMVAHGLASRPDLLAQVAVTPLEEKAKLNELCSQAREAAAAGAGSNVGQALHRATQRIALGEEVKLPSPWDKDLDAFGKAMEIHGIEPLDGMLERIIINEVLTVAGRFDRIVTISGAQIPVIADLKTGSTLEYSWQAISIQLACYARAEWLYLGTEEHDQWGRYLIDLEQKKPMPQVNQLRGLVIHLPQGQARCELHWVDLSAGWEAAGQAAWVKDWRRRNGLAKPL